MIWSFKLLWIFSLAPSSFGFDSSKIAKPDKIHHTSTHVQIVLVWPENTPTAISHFLHACMPCIILCDSKVISVILKCMNYEQVFAHTKMHKVSCLHLQVSLKCIRNSVHLIHVWSLSDMINFTLDPMVQFLLVCKLYWCVCGGGGRVYIYIYTSEYAHTCMLCKRWNFTLCSQKANFRVYF